MQDRRPQSAGELASDASQVRYRTQLMRTITEYPRTARRPPSQQSSASHLYDAGNQQALNRRLALLEVGAYLH
jgi:hypothetical protein